MGMTIDTAIAIIENPTDYFPKDIEETKHFMIDTMRKYQKIRDIVMNIDEVHYKKLMWIREILEDGND